MEYRYYKNLFFFVLNFHHAEYGAFERPLMFPHSKSE